MRIWATLILLTITFPLAGWAQDPNWPEPVWKPLRTTAMTNQIVRRLLIGYPDFTVKPDQIATRYEWAGIFSRLVWYYDLELPAREYLPPDVPWNHWAADACQVLMASGVYPGPPGVRFCGDKPLTRAQFAWMFANLYRRLQGEPYSRHPMSEQDLLYTQAGGLLLKDGLLIGYPDGKLHLERDMPRWQVCLAVMRLLVWSEKSGIPTREAQG